MESHGEPWRVFRTKSKQVSWFWQVIFKNVFRNISIKDFSSLFYLTVVSSDEFHKLWGNLRKKTTRAWAWEMVRQNISFILETTGFSLVLLSASPGKYLKGQINTWQSIHVKQSSTLSLNKTCFFLLLASTDSPWAFSFTGGTSGWNMLWES